MGNYENLKQSITEVIRTNGNQEITGAVLQSTLLTIISTVGANATFAGIATPTTNPGTPDGSVFYLSSKGGTYTNFGAIELQDGLSVLMWNGSWSSQQIFGVDDVPTAGSDNLVKSRGVQEELALGAVYDVSAKNPTAGVNNDGKFESLSALLGDANLDTLIPVSVRKGGMSIKFVQSSDNKYVQYRLMSDTFSSTESDWQGVTDEIEFGSKDLVESGSIYEELNYIDFSFDGHLDDSGIFVKSSEYKTTPYIEVNEGDSFKYSGCFWNTGIRGLVYGYTATDDTSPVVLVPTGQVYVNYEFTIPANVKYIRAWTIGSYTHNIYKSRAINPKLDILGDFQSSVGTATNKTMHQASISKNLVSKDNGIRDTTHYKSNGVLQCKVWCLGDDYTTETEVGISVIEDLDSDEKFHFYFSYSGHLIMLKKERGITEGKRTYKFENVNVTYANLTNVYAVITIDYDVFAKYQNESANELYTILHKGKDNDFKYYFNDLESVEETQNLMYKSISDYHIISDTPSTVNERIYLANNVQSPYNGSIIGIKFVAKNTKPFDIYTASKSSVNWFVPTRKLTVQPAIIGKQEIQINLPISKGEYLFFGQDGTDNQTFPGYSTEQNVIDDNGGGWYRVNETPVVGKAFYSSFTGAGVVNATFSVAECRFKLAQDNGSQIVYITATRNSANFNSIRDIINGIDDASKDRRYIVIVPDGEWFECDLQGKKYVKIKGQSQKGTIIYCDGSSDKITPSDYTWANYRNMALSNIPIDYKHIIAPGADLELENITLRAYQCKYAIHFEQPGWRNVVINNCIIKGTNILALIGAGLRGNQHIEFENCIFEKQSKDVNAIYIHNWGWEVTESMGLPLYGGGFLVKIKNSIFNNGGDLCSLGEIASYNQDLMIIENCNLQGSNETVRYRAEKENGVPMAKDTDGNTITNPLDVPYCIQLNVVKSDEINIAAAEDRPGFVDMVNIV